MKLLDIILDELQALFRGKYPSILLLAGIPIAYSILFGFAYSSNVIKYVPTVIYDQDQTGASRSLAQAYIDSERFDVVSQVTTQEAMEQAMRDNIAVVSISIPPKFSQNIKMGESSEVLLEANSNNIMLANAAIAASNEITQTFSAFIGQKLLEGSNQMPAPALKSAASIKMAVRIFNNPTGGYINFMLAGLGANGMQVGILLVAGTTLIKEYTNLSRWQHTSSAAIVIGKLLPYWWCSTATFAAYISIITAFFGVPFRSDITSVLFLGSAFAFMVSSICFFFSAIAKNEVSALQVPLLYIMPGLLYSGLSWPHIAMNGFAKGFNLLLPLNYLADTLRDLLLGGYSPALWKNIFIMYGSGGVLCLVSIFIFSRRRNPKARTTGGTGL